MSETNVNPALNYRQVDSSKPSYNYRKVNPSNGGSTTVTLASTGATQNTVFIIPAEVVNMGESYLQYDITLAGSAGLYRWPFKDVYGEFDYVTYRDSGSMSLVDLRYANMYSHVMNRINISNKELQYHDDLNGLVATNALNSDVKSIRMDNTSTSLAFKEPQHFQVGAITVDLVIQRRVYLKDLCRDSYFGMAKNGILPIDTFLEINWIGNKLGFYSTSATNPQTAHTVLGAITIANLCLKLAFETNQDLVKEMKSAIAGNLTVPIPWVRVHSIAASSATSWTYNLPLDNKQHGRKIKKIVYVPFATQGSSGNLDLFRTYDHCNNASVNDAMHQKIDNYFTLLNNTKLQRDNILCPLSTTAATLAQHDDYMLHKSLLENTTYFNQAMHSFNWLHIDAFDKGSHNDNFEGSVYVDGYDLVSPVTYTVQVDHGLIADVAHCPLINNVAIVVGQKLLSINSSSFAVV
jgi:hypothetical protein